MYKLTRAGDAERKKSEKKRLQYFTESHFLKRKKKKTFLFPFEISIKYYRGIPIKYYNFVKRGDGKWLRQYEWKANETR